MRYSVLKNICRRRRMHFLILQIFDSSNNPTCDFTGQVSSFQHAFIDDFYDQSMARGLKEDGAWGIEGGMGWRVTETLANILQILIHTYIQGSDAFQNSRTPPTTAPASPASPAIPFPHSSPLLWLFLLIKAAYK